MTRDEWRRIKQLATDALARPEGERAAFVVSQCGAEEALCREVLALLEATDKASDLYEEPVVAAADVQGVLAAAETLHGSVLGRRIGAYQIVAELGRGGMGAAYLAERADRAYEKHVAIKLIKRGMDTDAMLRRFRHERQILANLEHPNIARLLDGGTTEDGLPYYVMEYVDGLPIDDYCDLHKLPVAERLRLLIAVCAAVQYANDNLVIHRDLKPSNILVTKSGVPKLLDFGIAKLLDPEQGSQMTELGVGARAMTPEYASPEQIRGEPITAASDVYSLGVLMFKLLTGSHPYRFEGRTPTEIERIVCGEAPPRPSTVITGNGALPGYRRDDLRRALAGELDLITLSALRKEPHRRYASVQAFADDIARFLDGLPISARRDGWSERIAAFRSNRAARNRLRTPPRHRRMWTAAAATAVLILAAIVIVIVATGRHSPPDSSSAIESIAVLPLANTTGEPDLDYLAEGLTEDLIARLSRAPHLKVIARDSAYRYSGKSIDPQIVGRELGVQAILTGRLVRRGRELSISAELVDARDRTHLWGEQYNHSIENLQFLQRELAQRIADRLRLQMSREEKTRFDLAETRNPEAYQLYLKGRYFWNKRTAVDLQKSISYFRQAVERDPSFALAYSGLADSYGLLTEYHAAPARATYPDAKRAVTKSLALDDRLAQAHASLAYIRQFYEWDWPAAEQEFRRAIELNPTYATAHQWYAELLSAMGRHDEALAEIRRAAEIDPLSLIINSVEANILYMARQYDRAVEQCHRVLDMDPNFPEVYEYLKRAHDQQGAYAQAISARQRRRTLLGLDSTLTPALRAAAAATSRARYWPHRLAQERHESKTEGLRSFEFAELTAQVGDKEQALTWLERACDEPDFMTMYVRVAPNLDPLRNEPRFKQLLERSCRTTDRDP